MTLGAVRIASPLGWSLALLCLGAAWVGAAPGGDVVASGKLRETRPAASDADLAAVAAGNLAFAAALYALQPRGTNLFYSPYSLTAALAMLQAGARGDTAAQLGAALHYTLPSERLHPALNRLDLALASRATPVGRAEHGFQLSVANALWGQRGHTFLPAYLDLLAVNYGAGLRSLDFAAGPEPAREVINGWVARQTADRIKDLLPPKSITADTQLVLTNAVYFLAPWAVPFRRGATAPAPFTLRDGHTKSVPMMHASGHHRLAAGDGWQAVELMYAGNQLSLVVLLPAAGRFDELDRALDAARWQEVLGALKGAQVALSLPRFGASYSRSLSDDLVALGMRDAFDAAKADFSGIDGQRDLLVSDVVHKAFVKVDEDGTEAAAATAVLMAPTGVAAAPVPVTVDRPFMFVIRDIPTATVLFAGRVVEP